MATIRDHEAKRYSQHGEDGILAFLHSRLPYKNYRFVEIGCGSGQECNGRALLEEGWSGLAVDRTEMGFYRKAGYQRLRTLQCQVGPGTIGDVFNRLPPQADVFSLDIDSYDYYVADYLLRWGFRPKICCLEVNTFLGSEPLTAAYRENFRRYEIDEERGLYFGCSESAWRHLLESHGYRYLGMESSNTNAFFVLEESDLQLPEAGYQTYFCKKYGQPGEELSHELLANHKFLNVTNGEYEPW